MIDFSTAFYTTLGFSMFSAAMGYYIGDKGWGAVATDISDLKADIANIKGKIDGPTVTVTRLPSSGTGTVTLPSVGTGSVPVLTSHTTPAPTA